MDITSRLHDRALKHPAHMAIALEAEAEINRLREVLQTIRLATCDYTVGVRASLEAANKLATDALLNGNCDCGHCCGTGRMVRDPDIGTDQECFVCDGSGRVA